MAGDVMELVTVQEDPRDPVYIPVAVFCTAYARRSLIDAIKANESRFLYCDTDSMHLSGTEQPTGIDIHDSRLGAWKVEGTFSHARHLRAKTYIWDLNGEIGVTCAGMPSNIKQGCDFDNFHLGYSNLDENGNIRPGLGKLVPLLVRGGRTLVERPYSLK